MIFTCMVETPLGTMRSAAIATDPAATATDAALCGLWFIGQKHFPKDISNWCDEPNIPVFASLKNWLNDYFAKKKELPTLPLSPQGTPFQQTVWKFLLDIPYGKTCSYGDIAKKIAAKKGTSTIGSLARAVGSAVGRNPISLVIPCHRVLGASGSLTGYAGGIERKRALLELEGIVTL